jgi:hypothetical protein
MWQLHERKSFLFDNEYKYSYELANITRKVGTYNLDLDLVTILYQLGVSYPRRCELVGEKVTV